MIDYSLTDNQRLYMYSLNYNQRFLFRKIQLKLNKHINYHLFEINNRTTFVSLSVTIYCDGINQLKIINYN